MFEIGQQVLFSNTEDGVPVEVVVVARQENPSGACHNPRCCTYYDGYDVELPDGTVERTEDVWLKEKD